MYLRTSLVAASTLILAGACTARRGGPSPDDDAQVGLDASLPPIDASGGMDAGGPVDASMGRDSGPGKYDAGTTDSGIAPYDAGRDTGIDAPPDPCPEADLGSALGDAIATGNTAGAADDFSPGCGDPGAPDRAYSWTAPAAGSYVIDTNGSGYDVLIEVRAGSCGGSALDCNDDGPTGLDSSVTVTLAAGDLVVIIVDGYSGDSGDFQINIHEEAPEVCDNGTDDDRDGDVDCADADCSGLDLCIETGTVECFDGADNDGDGSIDCADYDCSTEPDCMETGATECHDGVDNDGDAAVDCDDGECRADCTEPGMCADGIDNDMDTLTDCLDDECACDPACTGSTVTCPDQDLGSAVGNAVAVGVLASTTCGERSGASCGSGGAGGEIEYLWTAPAAGTYVITTEDTTAVGGTYDTMLYVLDGSCTGAELACDDDALSGLLSSVTVTVAAGQQLLIVLDAYGATATGNYTLNINSM